MLWLIVSELRAKVVKANKANPALVFSNLDGTGHYFYATASQQCCNAVATLAVYA
ncbi:MAG: hypothetical protein V7K25_22065 [Nostoc sp.]|uniref:hypothetical protein n=1 Tax=Nostoc sp. TaxID=1180 RepID=UPI002FFAD05F